PRAAPRQPPARRTPPPNPRTPATSSPSGRSPPPRPALVPRQVVASAVLLAAGAAAGTVRWGTTWPAFVGWAAGFGVLAAGVVLLAEPFTRAYAARLLVRLRGAPQPAGSAGS
ncbi:MAG TPA: hypothetical protein VM759_09195, partial [Longimicrobium sp.]|nr:hypothetical protein [Longimicrobium sp.]